MTEQTVAEILRKVQRIEIVANRSMNDLLAGQYRSVFRGRGMEFDEVREYQPGDEIRNIDWNVTARTGAPHIKRYSEERELTVLFVLDVSASGLFGSAEGSKFELMVELSALLMFSALRNNDKVGLVLYANEIQACFPPRAGRGNVLRLIREMIAAKAVAAPAHLDAALEFVNRVQRRRAVVFVISDFLDAWTERSLASANRRHDVVAVTVRDPRERELPNVGLVSLRDTETGEQVTLDTGSARVRRDFAAETQRRDDLLDAELHKAGVDRLNITTTEPYVASLRQFFRGRERRQR